MNHDAIHVFYFLKYSLPKILFLTGKRAILRKNVDESHVHVSRGLSLSGLVFNLSQLEKKLRKLRGAIGFNEASWALQSDRPPPSPLASRLRAEDQAQGRWLRVGAWPGAAPRLWAFASLNEAAPPEPQHERLELGSAERPTPSPYLGLTPGPCGARGETAQIRAKE